MSLSVCIIARNEASHIAEALESVRWADERIVVNCGSTDNTAEVAAAHGAQVYDAEHTPNLNVNKNHCFRLARSEWILSLDADERVSPALAEEIQLVLARGPRENGFWIPRRNWYFGYPLFHGRQYPDYQLRLFRRGCALFPEQHIHEYLAVQGPVGHLRNPIEHFPYSTLSHYLVKLDRDTNFQAQWLSSRYGRFGIRTFVRHGLWRSFKRFVERYLLWGGFRDGFPGFWAAWLDGVNTLVAVAKWWHLSHQNQAHELPQANHLLR
ncbi:MAG: glycosyltransferase family 2 protein [Candidatus Kapabacteria bacterium]|nr:glycosyltransferase family 2 protein [Candidatus Kapabacteria bacterium]MCS7169582.1 glycosyltransferase family 2 protein [Candidatus Kapabacteria bacterium]MDW7997611.1 glycosyltransferase family 2 protein [Bacteroidota bacterium]MDW8225202.1 glycosyltransferase family 2 protein [Bacteroidota bacterium]